METVHQTFCPYRNMELQDFVTGAFDTIALTKSAYRIIDDSNVGGSKGFGTCGFGRTCFGACAEGPSSRTSYSPDRAHSSSNVKRSGRRACASTTQGYAWGSRKLACAIHEFGLRRPPLEVNGGGSSHLAHCRQISELLETRGAPCAKF